MKKVIQFFSHVDRYCTAVVIVLIALTAMSSFGYIYLINNTVRSTVAQDRALKQMVLEDTELAQLQSRYMQLTSGITLDFAYSQGFVDASKQQSFISKQSLSRTVSFNAI